LNVGFYIKKGQVKYLTFFISFEAYPKNGFAYKAIKAITSV